MAIDERVSRARSEYRAKLCGRIAELAALLTEAADNPESLAAAQRLAHRIYGSAGTFGFAAVGEAARAIDQALLGLQARTLEPSPQLWQELGVLLSRAREELCTT